MIRSDWRHGLKFGLILLAVGFLLAAIGFLVAPDSNLLGGFGPLAGLICGVGIISLVISVVVAACECAGRVLLVRRRARGRDRVRDAGTQSS